jgi:hypothetical protein
VRRRAAHARSGRHLGPLHKPETGRKIALKVYGTSGWDPDAFLMPGVDLAFDTIQ